MCGLGTTSAYGGATLTTIAGTYELKLVLHEAGTTRLWSAVDLSTGCEVAVKEAVGPTNTLAEEYRTARLVAGVGGVVRVIDLVEWEERLWLVMELVRHSLTGVVQASGGRIPEVRAARIGAALAEILDRLHQAGFVHGDLAPGNVLFDDRALPKLADLGATVAVRSVRRHTDGTVDLTPGYASPERLEGAPAATAEDVYALGACLYFAVEGRPPYVRLSPWSLVAAVLLEEPDPFRFARSRPFREIIRSMLSKDPAVRPPLHAVRNSLRDLPATA